MVSKDHSILWPAPLKGLDMLLVADRSDDCGADSDRSRVSDQDLLRSIGHDLAAVYTDVLRLPIPDGIAAVLSRLETSFQPSSDGRLSRPKTATRSSEI